MGFIAKYCDRKRIEKMLPYLSKDMKILDLGCGDGWLTDYLNSARYDCVGVDIHQKDKHPFYKGSAEKIPFPDHHFDCLIMIEVIEHISPSCYTEINRVLKDKGRIILSTILPKSDPLLHLMSKFRMVDPYVTPHINLVHIENLPWKLISKSNILLLDQFGVFEKV